MPGRDRGRDLPPWEAPNIANRAALAASATAIAAATWLSKERSTPSRSDRPQPGLSYLITVHNRVSRARNALKSNSSSWPVRCVTQPGSISSGGPVPVADQAIRPAGLAQYRITGVTP